MDIEFFNPKEADFHGVRTLVQNLLGGADFDASQLADAIITQVVACQKVSPSRLGRPGDQAYIGLLQLVTRPHMHSSSCMLSGGLQSNL